jgi:hypothetical protein
MLNAPVLGHGGLASRALNPEGSEAAEMTQRRLARYNEKRLRPALASDNWRADLAEEQQMKALEAQFVERERRGVAARAESPPHEPTGFMRWYEDLRDNGPGQGDPLFPWLADTASLAEMRWFIEQEIGGEAGFDDLVALTQVRMATTVKLELARNYWDEMGRGNRKGMHGPMLSALGKAVGAQSTVDSTVWESLALTNMMVALAANRRYAYQSIGALGVIELTAPGRAVYVSRGLERLGVSSKARHYFALHAVLDVKHSGAWNREIIYSILAEEPRAATAIAEGALLRLTCGERCFRRYRKQFGLAGA